MTTATIRQRTLTTLLSGCLAAAVLACGTSGTAAHDSSAATFAATPITATSVVEPALSEQPLAGTPVVAEPPLAGELIQPQPIGTQGAQPKATPGSGVQAKPRPKVTAVPKAGAKPAPPAVPGARTVPAGDARAGAPHAVGGKRAPAASVRTVELLSRAGHGDYDAATYSFVHALRDDPGRSITRNDWDLQFGNGGDVFSVTMVSDDRSRIVDLGEHTWEGLDALALAVPEAHAEPAREPPVPVVVGHIYLVRSVDRDTDLVTLVRVESLVPGDRVAFSWRNLPAAGP